VLFLTDAGKSVRTAVSLSIAGAAETADNAAAAVGLGWVWPAVVEGGSDTAATANMAATANAGSSQSR